MATCPNKSLKEWKDLVIARGENMAYFLWDKYEGIVPPHELSVSTLSKVNQFLDDIGVDIVFQDEVLDDNGNLTFTHSDIINDTIKVIGGEGRAEAWNSLPQRAAEFWYSRLYESELKDELLAYVNGIKRYKTRIDTYISNGKSRMAAERAVIGELIGNEIIKQDTPDKVNLLNKIINFIKKWLDNYKQKTEVREGSPITVAAERILNSELRDILTLDEIQALEELYMPSDTIIHDSDISNDVIVEKEDSSWRERLFRQYKPRSRYMPKTLEKFIRQFESTIGWSVPRLNTHELDALSRDRGLTLKLEDMSIAELVKFHRLNDYYTTLPDLRGFDELRKKYSKNPVPLNDNLALQGVPKKYTEIFSLVQKFIREENPEMKSIPLDDFVEEVQIYLANTYVLGFQEEKMYDDYNIEKAFDDTSSRHRKISLKFNNTKVDDPRTYSKHFQGYPTAFGSIVYFKQKSAAMIHELQSDFIESYWRTLDYIKKTVWEDTKGADTSKLGVLSKEDFFERTLDSVRRGREIFDILTSHLRLPGSYLFRDELMTINDYLTISKESNEIKEDYIQQRLQAVKASIQENIGLVGSIEEIQRRKDSYNHISMIMREALNRLNPNKLGNKANKRAFFYSMVAPGYSLEEEIKNYTNSVKTPVGDRTGQEQQDDYLDLGPLATEDDILYDFKEPDIKWGSLPFFAEKYQMEKSAQNTYKRFWENALWNTATKNTKYFEKTGRHMTEPMMIHWMSKSVFKELTRWFATESQDKLNYIKKEKQAVFLMNISKLNDNDLEKLIKSDLESKIDISKRQMTFIEGTLEREYTAYIDEYNAVKDKYKPRPASERQEQAKQLEAKIGVQLEYFTPLVTNLINTVIKEKGKEFPIFFSGYEAALNLQGQGAWASALLYAGPEEVSLSKKYSSIQELKDAAVKKIEEGDYYGWDHMGENETRSEFDINQAKKDLIKNEMFKLNDNKPFQVGFVWTAMSKIPGIKLRYTERIEGAKDVGGYIVDTTNYAYSERPLLQVKGTEGPKVKEQTLELIKNAAKKMGIKINTLTEYAKAHPEIDVTDINGLADLFNGVVAVAHGMENVSLTEEIVHIATAIIEQTNPNLITSLISRIGKYEIYQQTLNEYKNRPEYQLPDGKPDIRKIKKEALDKLIVDVVVSQLEGGKFTPELTVKENRNFIKQAWDAILEAFRALFKRTDIDLLQTVGRMVSSGNVGGKASDLKMEDIFLQTAKQNEFVDKEYQTALDVHNRMELILEVTDPRGEVVKPRHYLIDGAEVTGGSVTELIHKNVTFPDDKGAMNWGNVGHKFIQDYIQNHLLDGKGYARPESERIPGRPTTTLNHAVQNSIMSWADQLIDSYPEGTRFLLETMAYNPNYKGGLASTIDFQAFVPTTDAKGNPDVYTDILDWKFTSFKSDKYSDLSPGKQKTWKAQMDEYVKMKTSSLYKTPRSKIRKARMVPFISYYGYNKNEASNNSLVLDRIEVGDPKNPANTKLYLLDVPVDDESTGFEAIDQLIVGLQRQRAKMYEKLRDPQKRFEKDPEMAAITGAIKKLRIQLDFTPLYSVGITLTKRISESLDAYENIKFDNLDQNKIEEMLGELIDYQVSLEKFSDLRGVYSDFLGKEEEQLTDKERQTQNKIRQVSVQAEDIQKKITLLQQRFVKAKAVKEGIIDEEYQDDVLKAESAINYFAYSFLEGTRLPAKIIALGSKLILNARKLVDVVVRKKIQKFNVLLLELEKQASAMGVKAFDLIGQVNDNDLQLINKIKKEYYDAQKQAILNDDRQFFKDNMDVEAYRAEVAKILGERYKILDNTVYTLDKEENAARIKAAKAQLRNKIDIFSDGFYGLNDSYFLFIYRKNFLEEKHYSKEFIELKKNEAAYKVWEFFMELNRDARDLGYLTKQRQAFFPLIEATSLQKLAQTKNYGRQVGNFVSDTFMSRINESMEYNLRDPETGEIRKQIPKYFTKTDKNVEQLSRDLNLVGALWIKSIEQYRSSKQLENTLQTLHMVEKAKGTLERGGVVHKDVNPNAEFFQKIIDDGLYRLRESADSLGNTIIDFGVGKFSKTEEGKEKLGLNTRKVINSANDLVRLLALGMKYFLGLANYVGTQMQTFIKSGEFYTFAEYEKNHGKVMFSNFGTLTDIQKGILDLFVPLNEDITLETRREGALKQGYLKYLSTWSFTDTLMLTMQFPEKKLQFANALSFLDNTMIRNGQLVNIRQWLREQDRKDRSKLSTEERKQQRKTFDKRVKELRETEGLDKVAKFENDELVIPGISIEEIARYRAKIIDYNRTLNGMMDENDKMGFRRDTLFSSFMMFKSWIPKLVYVRTQPLQKNLLTGNFEYGRMRAFGKAFLYKDMSKVDIEAERNKAFINRISMNVISNINNIKDIIYANERGMKIMNDILYEKKMAHFKATGQHLVISEEEFQDVMRDAIVNQFKELGVLTAVMGSYIGAAIAEPPEDASPLEINRYKGYFKAINKISDEITFFYSAQSAQSILQGTFLPALSLVGKVNRFMSQLSQEVWGEVTDNEELIKSSHPTKYFFNLIPILAQLQHEYLPYFDPELAKEMGIRVTKESRKN